MVTASFISRLSQAVDLIEKRSQQNRPWKVVTVRRGHQEDPDAARDRHFAAHPEDRDANVVIFEFYDDEERPARARIVTRRLNHARGALKTTGKTSALVA